ncbi:MAG: hypothetical protein ACOYNS_13590 [Bacteroidota bacterium]
MNDHYNDLLQRCLDEDLNDVEMKQLFTRLSSDEQLRKEFRSLTALKNELRRIPDPIPPINSQTISRMNSSDHGSIRNGGRISFNRLITSKTAVRIPVLAALLLAVGLAGYGAMMLMFPNQSRTEYVYVVEMPPVIIQSSYSN